MSDELNVWRDAKSMQEYRPLPSQAAADELSAAVIRDYGDRRDATARSEGHAKGYQQAIADVVEWLRVQQHGRTSDNYPGYYARQIEQRFGKDA